MRIAVGRAGGGHLEEVGRGPADRDEIGRLGRQRFLKDLVGGGAPSTRAGRRSADRPGRSGTSGDWSRVGGRPRGRARRTRRRRIPNCRRRCPRRASRARPAGPWSPRRASGRPPPRATGRAPGHPSHVRRRRRCGPASAARRIGSVPMKVMRRCAELRARSSHTARAPRPVPHAGPCPGAPDRRSPPRGRERRIHRPAAGARGRRARRRAGGRSSNRDRPTRRRAVVRSPGPAAIRRGRRSRGGAGVRAGSGPGGSPRT